MKAQLRKAVRLSLAAGLLSNPAVPGGQEFPAQTWPAESEQDARNLTELSGAFEKDLSGAVWNPVSRTLWVCRNGPRSDSRLWALAENESGLLQVASRGERRAEWKELGDCEGVTFADFEEETVYLIIEGEEKIHEVDVSNYDEAFVRRIYDTSPYLPRDGRLGSEGITFVPDESLSRAGFVDTAGVPRTSRFGMGGLMFVGHQNGGGTYVFDLARETGAVEFVGEYRVPEDDGALERGLQRIVGLEFDRSTDLLFVWHGRPRRNLLNVVPLSSTAVPDADYRVWSGSDLYPGPSDRSYEGLALTPITDCESGKRTLFLTVDDGGPDSLLRYDAFSLGCGQLADMDRSLPANGEDVEEQ